VDVVGPSLVVAREEGLEANCTVLVGDLDAAEGFALQKIGISVSVAEAAGNSAVNSLVVRVSLSRAMDR
jgi:hypothetical protein